MDGIRYEWGVLALLVACAQPPPDILLVTLDTTRADALGVYGAAPSPTPNFDAVAAGARVFEEAQTVAPLTLPAHASILTGLLPARHGVRRNGVEALPEAVETVAERIAAGGYQAGAFVSAVILDPAFGLSQGFGTYVANFEGGSGPVVPSHDADDVTDGYARWLLGLDAAAPFFAWVHYYDPHLPNEGHANGFDDAYLSEVAFMDDRFGRLLAATRATGRDRPLAIVVVGDHGEARGDHGEATHGWFVYRSTTRVPLFVSAPGVEAGRVAEPVSVVDVAATILGIAGLGADGLDGRDLRGEIAARPVFGETFTPRQALGFAELRFVQDARWRYVLAPRPELYDWRADPGETRDLGGEGPEAARLRALIDDAGTFGGEASSGADALGEQLVALGYTDAAAMVPGTVAFDALPDPKDDPGALLAVDVAIARARTVPPSQGVPVLEEALRRYPNAGAVRASLSRGYELLGRLDEAFDVVAPAGLEADAVVRSRRAQVRLAQGRLDEADALADGVEGAEALLVRAEVARRRGELDRALVLARAGLARSPRSPELALVAGAALVDAGRHGEAVPVLERTVAVAPGHPEARLVLAIALAETGDLDGARARLEEQRARFGASGVVDVALGKVEAAAGDVGRAWELLAPRADDPAFDWQAAVVCADLRARAGASAREVAVWRRRAERLGGPVGR